MDFLIDIRLNIPMEWLVLVSYPGDPEHKSRPGDPPSGRTSYEEEPLGPERKKK
jgi:hypothetical protein